MLGIFYYPWYGGPNNPEVKWRHWKNGGHNPPETWNARYLPYVFELTSTTTDPSIRLYDSFDQEVVKRQMSLIRNAHINFVIWSWWGKESFSDHAFSKFWNSGNSNNPLGLMHCVYYEKEWLNNVPYEEIKSDIDYIKSKYATDSKYLKINSSPVLFVYNSTPLQYRTDSTYQVKLSDKWNEIRQETNVYTVLKVFRNWRLQKQGEFLASICAQYSLFYVYRILFLYKPRMVES